MKTASVAVSLFLGSVIGAASGHIGEGQKTPKKPDANNQKKSTTQDVSEKERKEGFRPLFDGKSFEGWKTSDKTPKSWKIEEGMLILTGGNAHLFTIESFEDFVVRFEWRPKKKGFNSGFYIRGNNQIQMQQQNVGQWTVGKKTKGVPDLHNPPGEWNEWEVICIGPKVALKVNGKPAWEIDDFKAKKGPLGIEAEGHPIDFRKLRIRLIGTKE